MTDALPYMRRPCSECPFRVDAPLGRFSSCRYDALRETVGEAGGEAPLGAPIFACHKSHEGADRACAGWLATVGHEHIGIRFAIVTGRLPAEALEPGDDWPELYGSYDEMAEANSAELPGGAVAVVTAPGMVAVRVNPFRPHPPRCYRCVKAGASGLLDECEGHR